MNPFILYSGQPRPRLACVFTGRCLHLLDGPFCAGPMDCPYLTLLQGKPITLVNKKPSARSYFTAEQIKLVISLYGSLPAATIGEMLGRSQQDIIILAYKLRKMGKLPPKEVKP